MARPSPIGYRRRPGDWAKTSWHILACPSRPPARAPIRQITHSWELRGGHRWLPPNLELLSPIRVMRDPAYFGYDLPHCKQGDGCVAVTFDLSLLVRGRFAVVQDFIPLILSESFMNAVFARLVSLLGGLVLLTSSCLSQATTYQDWSNNLELSGMGLNIGQQDRTIFCHLVHVRRDRAAFLSAVLWRFGRYTQLMPNFRFSYRPVIAKFSVSNERSSPWYRPGLLKKSSQAVRNSSNDS